MKKILFCFALCMASTSQAYTDSKGKEWRKLSETLNISAAQAVQLCKPICSGVLAGYTFANGDEVAALLSEFNPYNSTHPFSLFYIGGSFVNAFGVTQSMITTYSMYQASIGLTSSVDSLGRPINAMGFQSHRSTSVSGGLRMSSVPSGPAGLFLYKTAK